MRDLGGRTARGGMIAIGSQAVRILLQLANFAILSRLLVPDDFGIVAMAVVVTGFVSIFTDLGLSMATIQRQQINQQTVSALFYLNLAVGGAVTLLAWALAPVAAALFDDARVTWVVVALAASLPFNAAAAQHTALLIRRMRFGTVQLISVTGLGVGLVIGVLAAAAGLHYWALVFAAGTNAVIVLVLSWRVSGWRPSRVPDWRGARESISFGLYLTGFNFMNYFHRQLDNLLVGGRWGSVELGNYSRAYAIFLLPLTGLVWPIGSALGSALCRLQDNDREMERFFVGALAPLLIVTSMGFLIVFSATERIVDIFLGQGWNQAVPILHALSYTMLIQPIYSSVGNVYIARGRVRQKFLASLITTAVYVLAFAIGSASGGVGVATAYSVAVFLIVPGWFAFAFQGSSISAVRIAFQLSPTLIAAALALGLTHLCNMQSDIAVAAVSTVVYFLILSALVLIVPTFRRTFSPTARTAKRLLLGWREVPQLG